MVFSSDYSDIINIISELRFVATVTTGGHVKFVPAVWIFPENNAISRIILIELQDLYTLSVNLHLNTEKLNSNKKTSKIIDIDAFALFLFE